LARKGNAVRSALLVLGQFISAVMVVACLGVGGMVYLSGDHSKILTVVGGLISALYWAAMFVVFGAALDFIVERERLGPRTRGYHRPSCEGESS